MPRKTKIICTLGPAVDEQEMMEGLIKAGMNVARFNFSHGDYEEQKKRIETFKKARTAIGLPIAMLLDTKGPEIRKICYRGSFSKRRRYFYFIK